MLVLSLIKICRFIADLFSYQNALDLHFTFTRPWSQCAGLTAAFYVCSHFVAVGLLSVMNFWLSASIFFYPQTPAS